MSHTDAGLCQCVWALMKGESTEILYIKNSNHTLRVVWLYLLFCLINSGHELLKNKFSLIIRFIIDQNRFSTKKIYNSVATSESMAESLSFHQFSNHVKKTRFLAKTKTRPRPRQDRPKIDQDQDKIEISHFFKTKTRLTENLVLSWSCAALLSSNRPCTMRSVNK